jgi:hypothetical protein
MAYDYGQHFGDITLTQDLTTLPEERTWRLAAPGRAAKRHQIVLHLGCNVLRTSHMIRTITAIFDRLGLDYVAVGGPTYCCGIVHHRNGDTAAGAGMNRRTVELFQRYEPDEVVMWCPSCIYFYDEVQQFAWPFPVRHATEFLASRLPALEFSHRVDGRVALHYHSQSEPRRREGAAARAPPRSRRSSDKPCGTGYPGRRGSGGCAGDVRGVGVITYEARGREGTGELNQGDPLAAADVGHLGALRELGLDVRHGGNPLRDQQVLEPTAGEAGHSVIHAVTEGTWWNTAASSKCLDELVIGRSASRAS